MNSSVENPITMVHYQPTEPINAARAAAIKAGDRIETNRGTFTVRSARINERMGKVIVWFVETNPLVVTITEDAS